MKRLFTPAALSAALALSFAPATGAWAANITITNPPTAVVGHNVCGNSDDAAQGDCAQINGDAGNTVTIGSGVTLGNHGVYGRLDTSGTVATTATGNTLHFSGTVAPGYSINGGYAYSTADSLNATANGNTVLMAGGGAGYLQGGFAECQDHCTAEASNNTVTITGGTVSSNSGIYGGRAYLPIGSSSVGIASNNTVEIKGSANINTTSDLAGGGLYGGASGSSTGNTLELYIKGVTVRHLYSFQNLNFHVPATLAAGQTMLAASYLAELGASAPALGVGVEAGSPLKVGDEIVLIDAGAGSLTGTLPTTVTSLTPGYTFDVVSATNQLRVKVLTAPVKTTSSAAAVPTLGETALALLALLLAGGAMAAMRRR